MIPEAVIYLTQTLTHLRTICTFVNEYIKAKISMGAKRLKGGNAPFFRPLPPERLFSSTASICPRDRRTSVTRVSSHHALASSQTVC